MERYSELRARAAEFVAEWVQWGAVLVLASAREAADEVALEACGDASTEHGSLRGDRYVTKPRRLPNTWG
jgi:hypothetical protein